MSAELREKALAVGERRSSMAIYRIVRGTVRRLLFPFFRVVGHNVEVLDIPGPVILAPVHRSNLDSVLLASLSSRRIRALGKESLFTTPGVSWICAALGAIPVRRGEADRDALAAARMLLDRGESMIVFPEGTRQSGAEIAELFDGAAWLSARTGARVVPIGIAGTEEALPSNSRFPKRGQVRIRVGDPIPAPTPLDGQSRVSRDQLREFTKALRDTLQNLQDDARAEAGLPFRTGL
ncbi:MAG: 1-acyl-sn-glycerol-3-phosphate acyltransferase [Actinomycetia bacterium]|nr:1-acyl-sn-glycerol-3-phosphate acyltransferase [Actinomycetes bacterium]